MVRTDNLALSNIESQLVLGLLGELAQLYAMHFATDLGGDIIELCLAFREEVTQGRVRVFAVVIVLEGFKRSVSATVSMNPSILVQENSPLRLIIPDGEVVNERCRRLLARSLNFVFMDIS